MPSQARRCPHNRLALHYIYTVQVHVNGASSSLINPYSNCIFRLLHCSVLVLIWLVVAVVVYIQCKLQSIIVI